MEKLTFKTLTSQEEIEFVLQKVESNHGVRLPTEYANNSKIVGAFLQGQLSACYMLVTRPEFRSLLFVPDHIKKSSELLQNDKFEMMEVNGLWIGPSLKNHRCN